MIFDKLGDFNIVVQYYSELLNFSKKLKPNALITNPFNSYGVTQLPLGLVKVRAMINSMVVSFGQNFDRICERDIDGNITSKVSEANIINEFKNKPFFEKLMKENNLTAFETLRQIRNCFLHGHYEIEANIVDSQKFSDSLYRITSDELNILIDNQKIKGKLTYNDLSDIEYICSDIKSLYTTSPSETYVILADDNYATCKNNFYLEKYIKSLKKINISGNNDPSKNDNTDDILLEIQKKYNPSKSTLNSVKNYLTNLKKSFKWTNISIEEDTSKRFDGFRQYYKSYIKYLGHSNFEYLNTKEFTYVSDLFWEDIVQSYISQHATVGLISSLMESTTLKTAEKDTFMTNLELRKLSYEGPIIYTNLLLGLTNYTCGLLRELNGKEAISSISIFEYHNLKNLDFLNISIDNPENPSIIKNCSGTEKTQKIENSIKNYTQSIETKKTNLQKAKDRLSKITDKTPNKEQKEREQNEKIQSLEDEIKKLESYVERLKLRKNDYIENYDDYNNFFIHMRNSISHGFYRIDYTEALNSKNFDKIKFVFEDYSETDSNIPHFRLEIDAKHLIKLIKSIQEKVNSQIQKENTDYFSNMSIQKSLDEIESQNAYRITAQALGNATFDGINANLSDEASKTIYDAQRQKSTKEEKSHD